MVKHIIYFAFVILLFSCNKDNITPGHYTIMPAQPDTSHWYYAYVNSGVLPSWGNENLNSSNELVGTTWILTQVLINLSTTIKNDTIHFVTNTVYYVGYDVNNTAHYSLYPSQNNVTLTFQPFLPVNYMQCSTNQLGIGFASGTNITGVEFTNLYNTNSSFKAWFVRI